MLTTSISLSTNPETPVASGNEGTDLHIDAGLIESNWDTVVDK